ncbi:hemolysin-type calcium-binding repeat family protein [Lyngbya aestuarii BL J]|uniref:Hemolysin-type calcium-binding repeat family protein n=1 Tax=Lyngbya aestuarii BL J TaxID=1348334 RepID=U7Q945_9CYAN|nr:calcium-binding protein [Lyngbya aestuarii]ERT04308.1 hemolysin-type calcium-binding repeat family protein [Lyngbya aestuarii BL J]
MVLTPDISGLRLIGDASSENVLITSEQAADFPEGVFLQEGDDTVTGSFSDDLIFGNQGEDLIFGSEGDDTIYGGEGKDFLGSLSGDSVLLGNLDNDLLVGGAGNEQLFGGQGNDLVGGDGNGNDTLSGDLGRDYIVGRTENFSNTSRQLYLLQAEPNIFNVNSADIIVNFLVGVDQFGLTGELTSNNIALEEIQNVPITFNFDGNQAFEDLVNLLDPSLDSVFSGLNRPVFGTLIREASTGTMIAVVENVTPEQIEASFITV